MDIISQTFPNYPTHTSTLKKKSTYNDGQIFVILHFKSSYDFGSGIGVCGHSRSLVWLGVSLTSLLQLSSLEGFCQITDPF